MDLLYTGSSINKDGYINMIEELKKHSFSSLKLALKDYNPPSYLHKQPRHTSEIWKNALKSDRVQWIIQQTIRSENKTKEEVVKECEDILKELAFTDHLSLARMLAFALFKVHNSIYPDGVFINMACVEKIREVLHHHPVVFMPSHRSYMDFLMLSLACFYLNLPLPAIAAGMDFKSMAIISTMLRASGAFFMRRSFGSDRLYWALFTEYVHTILVNGDRPMEFFIEGTRSRVGKSLNPKFGLLSVVSEPYLKAQTYDIMIVPISLSYDRLLEEKLYAYEMLGIPKPKESTSGVFKATSILQENYGSVHLHFGNPLSLRDYFGSHLDRSVHACYPRYMINLSPDEQLSMKVLAYQVLLKQQKNMTCTPFTAIAAIMSLNSNGLCLSSLVEELQWLKPILSNFGARIVWSSSSMRDVAVRYLYRFKHLLKTADTNDQSHVPNDRWISIAVSNENLSKKKTLTMIDQAVQNNAANHIMLASYRNQLLCYMVRPAFVALSLLKLKKNQEENVFAESSCFQDFDFLVKLFQKEFIFEPNSVNQDFKSGLDYLLKSGVLTQVNPISVQSGSHSYRVLNFLRSTFSPFLVSYWLTCQYLLASQSIHDDKKISYQVMIF